MDARDELEQLRAKIDAIGDDLRAARVQIVLLETRLRSTGSNVIAEGRVAQAPELPVTTAPLPPPLPPMVVGGLRLESAPVKETVAADAAPASDGGALPFHREPEPEFERRTKPFAPAGPSPIKVWLQQLHLWPPSDETNAEVRLGAWWATRIGALFAIIGVVFFGIYISVGRPPWIKFTRLAVIAVLVTFAGLWLERRIAKFGAVVFASGLALIYFVAFAGYALPAMKVIHSLPTAALWQFAAVGVLAGAAIWRRSPAIATLAVGFGYVTSLFAQSGGLNDFALGAAALLAVVAVVFQRAFSWEAPSVVALPGAYAVYLFVLLGNWAKMGAPARGWAWLYLGGMLLLFFARDWRSQCVAASAVSQGERWFQSANTSAAALLGVITALMLYRAHLTEFYFGLAVIFGGLAWLRHRQVEGDLVSPVLIAKTTGALTLGVIEVADGRTTAIALLVQAWVMTFTAKRLASRVLGVSTGLVAAASVWFFISDAIGPCAAFSVTAAMQFVYVAALVLLGVTASRLIGEALDKNVRTFGEGVVGSVAGALGFWAVLGWSPEGWTPAFGMAGVAMFGALTALRRVWAPAISGLVMLGAVNVVLWSQAFSTGLPRHLSVNALVVFGAMVALGAWLGGQSLRARNEAAGGIFARIAFAFWALAAAGAVAVTFKVFEQRPALALGLSAVAASALVASASALVGRRAPMIATGAASLAVGLWLVGGTGTDPRGWLAMAAVALWLPPVLLRAVTQLNAERIGEPNASLLEALRVALAPVVTVHATQVFFTGPEVVPALALVAVAACALWRRPGIPSALVASWFYWASLWERLERGDGSREALVLIGGGVSVVFAWAQAVVLARFTGAGLCSDEEPWWHKRAAAIQVVLAAILAATAARVFFDGYNVLLADLGAVGLAVAASRFGGMRAAKFAALVAGGLAFITATFAVPNQQGLGGGWAAVMLVAGVVVALPRLVAGGAQPLSKSTIERLRLAYAIAGLLLAFYLAVAQRGELAPYASVAWGLSAIAVFLTGLFARSRPHRLVGLAGIALCVPRVFIVDLDSTLYRIAAFVVLGLVMLWVGFSYHKFRHLVVDESGAGKSS